MSPSGVLRYQVTVSGIVQGVGFRPFVHRMALDLQLTGRVANNGAGVSIEIQGRRDSLDAFLVRLVDDAPPLASIESIESIRVPPSGAEQGFVIGPSTGRMPSTTLISPDVATCDDCLAEIRDPDERRAGYAFTNCTNCGPRYTIVTDIPYDRPNTTMAGFELCGHCRREYEDPSDRRFHAQPVCCPTCGPELSLPVTAAADALRRGEILAVKGLGGFHLAAVAADERTVATLRHRKERDDKPFAVMVADLDMARRLCEISTAEAELLSSAMRPIVLSERLADAPVAPSVAPRTRELGLLLPYAPLHHLLLDELDEPIVCTSGNTADEPIVYRDQDAVARLEGIADRFLTNDRPIRIRVDDSVARVVDGRPYLVRRSRGYAPAPLLVPWSARRPILACGADLKNVVALARGSHVFLSHHVGDLHQVETNAAFVEAIGHLCRLFEVEPAVVAYDLHPQYRSSAFATELADVDHVPVQHHHAHIASCLADNNRAGPAIGVAFDGLGYGDDGTLWGGEFLVADLIGYERRAWFEPVPLLGGDVAAREPWRMAAAYAETIGEADSVGLAVAERNARWADVIALARSRHRSPLTSSVGRLFDAVAALLGVRDTTTYEGQAAIELEQVADPTERGYYSPELVSIDGATVVSGSALFAAALAELRAGLPPPTIAARFHNGLAEAVLLVCREIRATTGLAVVALSGGVFLNALLLDSVTRRLDDDGFEVLRHRRVPTNDGGISLGQAVIAAARDRVGGMEIPPAG